MNNAKTALHHSIFVLGAGAMGCLWAYYLHQQQVLAGMITRNRTLNTTECLQITTDQGHTNHASIPVVCAKALTNGYINHLLVCTKATQIETALEALAPKLATNATILLLSNGLGFHQHLTNRWPQWRFYAAITTQAARLHSPWHVEHTGIGHSYLGGLSLECTNYPLLSKLRSTGLAISEQTPQAIHHRLWHKWILNCCINPLTAWFDCLNGELLEIDYAQALMKSILTECLAIACANGVTFAEIIMWDELNQLLQATAANSSSMRQDVRLSRPSELPVLNGFASKEGQRLGLATPTNDWVVAAINALEQTSASIDR